MATIKTILLDRGKEILNQAMTGSGIVIPHSFSIGSSANYELDPLAAIPQGTVVFTGSDKLISAREQDVDTVRYVLTIPETEGPFVVGNIIFYVDDGTGNPAPYMAAVLPIPVRKLKYEGTPTPGQPAIPGNRFAFNLTIKHTGEAAGTVNIVVAASSSLASFETDLAMPPPNANLWQQFSIQNHGTTHSPVIGMRRSDDTYWGVPAWQRLNDPDFGSLDGGVAGDGYMPWGGLSIYGAYYTTPETRFTNTINGGTYTDPPPGNLTIDGGDY